MNRNYRYYVGIDCGVITGYAVWWKERKVLSAVNSAGILACIEELKHLYTCNPGAVFVRVEDARLRKWIPKQKNEKAERGKREGAGSVKRDAIIWQEFLESWNIDHEFVAPKNNKTKVAAEYFKKLTGWPSPTNSHARDAAMLVFGF